MQTVSEEICGEYLKCILKCDFIQYNINNPDTQGEIDVIGINLKEKKIYICEVAAHTQGLLYVGKDKKPDDYNRFYSKFQKNIDYVKKYFTEYTIIIPMLWSPVVKISRPEAYNTFSELQRLKKDIDSVYQLNLELIINEKFEFALSELRFHALKQTAHFPSPIMRMFQIEEHLKRHLNNYRSKGII